MAAIGRLVRLAPKLKELSLLHRNICKANVAFKPFKLPPHPHKSHSVWNLVRYCSSESVLARDVSAADLDESHDRNRPSHSLRRQQPRRDEDEDKVHNVATEVSDWLNMYFSISKEKVEKFIKLVETHEYKIQKYDMVLLLKCMGDFMPGATKEEKCQMVDHVWSKLKENNYNLDHQIYNTLIMVYVENDHPFSPAEMLQEMQDNGIEPNMVTFKRIIAAYCNKGDVTSAKQLLEFMQAENITIGPEVFNSFIKGHMINRDLKGAETVLEVMRDINLTVTDGTYARIICGLADMKEISEIPRFLEEIKQIQCRLTSVVDIMISMKENGLNEFDSELDKMMQSSMLFLSDFAASVNKCLSLGYTDIAEKLNPLQNYLADKRSSPGYLENYIHGISLSRDKETLNSKLIDLINESKTITAELPSLVYTFYQLNLHDFAVQLLDNDRKKNHNVSAHCFFPAVIHYKKSGNMEKMTDLLGIMSNYEKIERKNPLSYIAAEMMPFFVKNLDGENNVIEFLKKNMNNDKAFSTYFLYLLQSKTAEEALEFAKNNNMSMRYYLLIDDLQHISDYKTLRSIMDMCSGEGYHQIRAHERYLRLVLTHGKENNAWDEVEKILQNEDLMIFSPPKEFDKVPESIRKRMQTYVESQLKFHEQITRNGIFILRRRLIEAVSNGNVGKSKDILNQLFKEKSFREYELILINFLELCVEIKDVKGAIDYFIKYSNLHKDELIKKRLMNGHRMRMKTIELLNKISLISLDQAEQLKKLFVECALVKPDFQIFSAKEVKKLLHKDLNECTDHVVELYLKSQSATGIIFLLQEFINSENNECLQDVIDRMIPKLGERVVLSYLTLSLINCDQIQKAVRVCSVQETDIPTFLCKFIDDYGEVEHFEGFVQITKSMSNRADLLFALMKLYLKKRMYDKALRVVDMYEEEFLEMKEDQKHYLVSKLFAAHYPIPLKLKEEDEMFMMKKKKDEVLKNKVEKNEQVDDKLNDKLNEQVDDKLNDKLDDKLDDIDWFKTTFSLNKLYQKDSDLFDKVTSEVKDDKKKLTQIFMNLLLLHKTDKAKEFLSKHPDILKDAESDIFLELMFYVKNKNDKKKIEQLLRREFTDRRDLLLKFHTEYLCFIVHRFPLVPGLLRQKYDKILEDGFHISDINIQKLTHIENKLSAKKQPIPWKIDSNNETIVSETSEELGTTAQTEELDTTAQTEELDSKAMSEELDSGPNYDSQEPEKNI